MAGPVQKGAVVKTFGGTTVTPALTSNGTAGNLAVIVCYWARTNGGLADPPPTPSGWSVASAPQGVDAVFSGYKTGCAIYYKENIAGAALSAAVVCSESNAAMSAYMSEWPYTGTGLLDVIAHAEGASPGGTSGNSGTTGTTAQANELVIAALSFGQVFTAGNGSSGCSNPATSGFTSLDFTDDSFNGGAGQTSYKETTSAGTQTAAWSWTPTSEWQGTIVTFKGVSSGAPLAAAATAVASGSPALSTQVRFAASAAAVASATATMRAQLAATPAASATATSALTTAIRLAAAAQAVATVTANANSGQLMIAAAAAVASATPGLTTAIRLAAAPAGVAAVTSALTNWTTVTLAGTLYTGVGGILDPHFWLDAVPVLGDTIYYDATFITIAPTGEISSSSNDCRAVVQFNNGSGWALGLVVITSGMVAYPTANPTASAALTASIQFATTAAAQASATSALSSGVQLATAASAQASGTTALTTAIRLAAAAQAVATGTTGFGGAAAALASTAAAVATGSAALSTSIVLAANASAVPTLTAPLTTAIRLAAAPASVASATSAITTTIQLAAAVQAVATATPQLAGTSAPLAANAVAASAVAAALTTSIRLAASPAAIASITVSLVGTANALAATATAAAATTATLLTQIQAAANASASASVSATLTSLGAQLAANAAATGVGLAALSTQIRLAAVASANALVTGQLFGTASALQAAAIASSSVSAALIGSPAVLVAQAIANASISATITNAGAPLVAAAQARSIVAAALSTQIQFAAQVQALVSGTGDLSVSQFVLPNINGRIVEFSQEYFAWTFPFKDPQEQLDYGLVFASLLPEGAVPATWSLDVEHVNPAEAVPALQFVNKHLATSGERVGVNDAIYFTLAGGTLGSTYFLKSEVVDSNGRDFIRRVRITVDLR